jgi:hypothetical protein
MSDIALLSSLQTFLNQRTVDVEQLTAEKMVNLMVDWFRLVSVDRIAHGTSADTMVFRYGGWSEGCVTGFKFGLARRLSIDDELKTEWLAGFTMLFEPSRFADIAPLTTLLSDWQSLEAFSNAIQSSPGFRLSANLVPMAISIESQGAR